MSHSNESNGGENPMFKWGALKSVDRVNKGLKFYESFTYCGVEYFLYDSVYFNGKGNDECYIGKLVKMFETPYHEKRVKVVWFFRPVEIRNFLGAYEPKWNEIFLASGGGLGLSNINYLESIGEKCNVVCASNDKRNPRPSEKELRMANYIFYWTFDVGKRRILEKFPDQIDGIKVELFFNKRMDHKVINPQILKPNVKELTHKSRGLDKVDDHVVKHGKFGSSSLVVKESKNDTASVHKQGKISHEHTTLRPKFSIKNERTEPRRTSCSKVDDKAKRVRFSEDLLHPNASDARPYKKRQLLVDGEEGITSDKIGSQLAQERGVKTVSKPVEVTGRQDIDKRRWFKQLPWEERLQRADERGSLVSLENLDPSFTSSEVEDLVWCALNERVEAKMIQHSTFSSPHYGKALVIFKSEDAAVSAISKLRRRCLMLTDGRPVVASRGSLRAPGKPSGFVGHLVVDELRCRRLSCEKRKAVSTAHHAQPNTIERELANEWCKLQKKSDMWWEALHKQQGENIEELRSQLKINRNK